MKQKGSSLKRVQNLEPYKSIVFDFGFIPFPDFKLKFKTPILAFSSSNSNPKLHIFNIANIKMIVTFVKRFYSTGRWATFSTIFGLSPKNIQKIWN